MCTLPSGLPHQSVVLKVGFIWLLHIYSQDNCMALTFISKGIFFKIWSLFSRLFLAFVTIHGFFWLPGILTWNQPISLFAKTLGTWALPSPEAFVIFYFSSPCLPSDHFWAPNPSIVWRALVSGAGVSLERSYHSLISNYVFSSLTAVFL